MVTGMIDCSFLAKRFTCSSHERSSGFPEAITSVFVFDVLVAVVSVFGGGEGISASRSCCTSLQAPS